MFAGALGNLCLSCCLGNFRGGESASVDIARFTHIAQQAVDPARNQKRSESNVTFANGRGQ
eukprot:4787604-Amphidinium_carterae.1